MGKLSTEQALMFLRPASYVDAVLALCEALQSAWAADLKIKNYTELVLLYAVCCVYHCRR